MQLNERLRTIVRANKKNANIRLAMSDTELIRCIRGLEALEHLSDLLQRTGEVFIDAKSMSGRTIVSWSENQAASGADVCDALRSAVEEAVRGGTVR